jgi:hypothetical protein
VRQLALNEGERRYRATLDSMLREVKLMKAIRRLLIVCVVLVPGSSVMAQSGSRNDGARQCSNQTLSGSYGAQIAGTLYIPNGPNQPIKVELRTISMGHYDGAGNVTFRDHVVVDGNPPPEEWREASGTYSVNPDCTGTFSVVTAPGFPPIVVYFVVVKHGTEIHGVTNASAITYSAFKVN